MPWSLASETTMYILQNLTYSLVGYPNMHFDKISSGEIIIRGSVYSKWHDVNQKSSVSHFYFRRKRIKFFDCDKNNALYLLHTVFICTKVICIFLLTWHFYLVLSHYKQMAIQYDLTLQIMLSHGHIMSLIIIRQDLVQMHLYAVKYTLHNVHTYVGK